MEETRFDTATKSLARSGTRRRLGKVLGAVAMGSTALFAGAAADSKRQKPSAVRRKASKRNAEKARKQQQRELACYGSCRRDCELYGNPPDADDCERLCATVCALGASTEPLPSATGPLDCATWTHCAIGSLISGWTPVVELWNPNTHQKGIDTCWSWDDLACRPCDKTIHYGDVANTCADTINTKKGKNVCNDPNSLLTCGPYPRWPL